MKASRLVACLSVGVALAIDAAAQPRVSLNRIGFLGAFPAAQAEGSASGCPATGTVYWQAFIEGLRARGRIPGRNLDIECRTTEGREDRALPLAEALVRLSPDLIVAFSTANVRAAKQATATIPIVFVGVINPAGRGIVASLAHPGGNVTGVADDAGTSTAGKLLQLAKELVPAAERTAILAYDLGTGEVVFRPDLEAAAAALGLRLSFFPVHEARELEPAFDAMIRQGSQVLVVLPAPFMGTHASVIVDLAARRKLPGVYPFREHAQAGGPVAYDIDRVAGWRRVGHYVDRILAGAKPGDLPVEQPTEFELIVNPAAAGALGVALPPSLQLRADEVIR